MANHIERAINLENVLAETLRALAVLDADSIEELAELLENNSGSLELARSAAEWTRLRSRLWILGHLLDGTGRRLEMLRQFSPLRECVGSYSNRRPRCLPLQRTTSGSMRGLGA